MNVIPESVIESAWNEISLMEESDGEKEIERISRTQPALLAFVIADSEELGENAQQLGLFVFVIILRMFEKHFGSGLKTVEMEAIERIRESVEQSMLMLQHVNEGELEQAALSQISRQPFVMRYVAEAIFEDNPDDGVQLTDDEMGGLAMTLKTVVDALDEASPAA